MPKSGIRTSEFRYIALPALFGLVQEIIRTRDPVVISACAGVLVAYILSRAWVKAGARVGPPRLERRG